jgi:hypothetical protein
MKNIRLKVFKNRVPRMFGVKRDEIIGGWRKLHNEEQHNLYSSHNINKMIKSRRVRWVEYVSHFGQRGI